MATGERCGKQHDQDGRQPTGRGSDQDGDEHQSAQERMRRSPSVGSSRLRISARDVDHLATCGRHGRVVCDRLAADSAGVAC